MKIENRKNNRHKEITSTAVAKRLLKKKVKRIAKSIFTIFILVGTLGLSSYTIKSDIPFEGPILDLTVVPELNAENVYRELVKAGVQHPEIVVKQAILETGWFGCEHCSLTRNNIFGFYYKKKYLTFDNWVESVEYYKNWQNRKYKGGDYFAFLKEIGYATSPTYIQKLKSIKLKFKIDK